MLKAAVVALVIVHLTEKMQKETPERGYNNSHPVHIIPKEETFNISEQFHPQARGDLVPL